MLEENEKLWLRLYELRTKIALLKRMRMVSHVAREELNADVFFPYLNPPANDFFTRLLAALDKMGGTPAYVPTPDATYDKQVSERMAAALAKIDQLYADVNNATMPRPDDELDVVEDWIAETQSAYRRMSADMAGAIIWMSVK